MPVTFSARRPLVACLTVAVLVHAVATSARAQDAAAPRHHKKHEAADALTREPMGPAPLFASEAPLEMSLTTNIKQLRHDKSQDAPWRAATIAYRDSAGATVSRALKIRTRGIWRLKNCEFPPIRLNFAKDSADRSLFATLDKPKLTTHCRDRDEFEHFVLRELQAYRIYSALTDYAHRARLAHMTYVDSATGQPFATRYGVLLEDKSELGRRMGAFSLSEQGAGPSDLDPYQSALFSLFQYMIGNTDWSVAVLHNVELFGRDTSIYPVAHDFDFAGFVNTSYAQPDPRLGIRSVRDRLFRGYCVAGDGWTRAAARFIERRAAIDSLLGDAIGRLLPERDIDDERSYLDGFYKVIGDPRRMKREIVDQCVAGR